MPRIPEYNEQFRYAGRAAGLGGRLDGGNFGQAAGALGESGRIAGRQWQQMGGAITKAANTAAAIYDDYNTTKAQQAVNGLQKNFLAWQSEMSKNKGEAGMDAGAQYEQWQKKQVAELTKGMNEIQRGRFNTLAEVKAAGFQQWAAEYGSEQGLVFQNAEDVAGIKAEADNLAANLTNVEVAKESERRIGKLAESIAQRKGLGEKATNALMRDSLAEAITPAIAAQIDAEKLSTARTALLYYKDKIGTANALKLQARIQAKGRELEARNRAARAEALFDQGEALANNYWSKVSAREITPSQALLELRDIKDPKLQRYARGSFSELVSINERVIKESEATGRAKAGDALMELDGKLQDQFALVQKARRDALGPGATPEMKAYAKALGEGYKFNTQFEEGGVKSGSSPASWEALTTGIAQGAYTSEKALKGSEHWASISPQGKQTLLSTLKNNQTVDLGEANRLYNEMYQLRNGSPYTASKGEGDKERFVQWAMEQARGSNRAKEPGYMQKLTDMWFMKSTIPSGRSWTWDTGGTFGELRGKGNSLPDIYNNANDEALKELLGFSKEELLKKIKEEFDKDPTNAEGWKKKYGTYEYAVRAFAGYKIKKALGPLGEKQ